MEQKWIQANFKARNHAPMSKGTRCHQLAEYVVFEAPLQMLSDSPSAYMREQECTDFITSVPMGGESGENLNEWFSSRVFTRLENHS